MPVKPDRKAATHARIVKTASRAIRRSGYHGVGVADMMKQAGLTHGGFYAHFESRNALLAEAAAAASENSLTLLRKIAEKAGPEHALPAVLDAYLSDGHVSELDRGCPIAALGSEMPRQAPEVRAAASRGIEQMAELLASHMAPGRQDVAFGLMSCMVGALLLARAADDPELSAAIRASAQEFIRSALPVTGAVNE